MRKLIVLVATPALERVMRDQRGSQPRRCCQKDDTCADRRGAAAGERVEAETIASCHLGIELGQTPSAGGGHGRTTSIADPTKPVAADRWQFFVLSEYVIMPFATWGCVIPPSARRSTRRHRHFSALAVRAHGRQNLIEETWR
jgi:hypothetical protein